jgi:hypothetical protein
MTAWHNVASIGPKQFRCGHCGLNVGNDRGYHHQDTSRHIWVCPSCDRPTYFDSAVGQVPGPIPGNDVDHLPDGLKSLYTEARRCSAISAYTSSVLACRKMLMNISVTQGADEGGTFVSYVNFLAAKGYVPPNGKGWVDHIRKKGNEATHEIVVMTQADAEELLAFVEMLLKFIYEFPAKVPTAT